MQSKNVHHAYHQVLFSYDQEECTNTLHYLSEHKVNALTIGPPTKIRFRAIPPKSDFSFLHF